MAMAHIRKRVGMELAELPLGFSTPYRTGRKYVQSQQWRAGELIANIRLNITTIVLMLSLLWTRPIRPVLAAPRDVAQRTMAPLCIYNNPVYHDSPIL